VECNITTIATSYDIFRISQTYLSTKHSIMNNLKIIVCAKSEGNWDQKLRVRGCEFSY